MDTPTGFTVIYCGTVGCPPAQGGPDIGAGLHQAIRECPHGVLVRSECVLALLPPKGCPLAGDCQRDPAAAGAFVLIQPCDAARHAHGPAHLAGPLHETTDIADLRRWLLHGLPHGKPLPEHLCPTIVADNDTQN